MEVFQEINNPAVAQILRSGGIGIIRTDTLYGVVASAHNEQAVARVYALKHRDQTKSPIVLVGSFDQLFDEPTNQEMAVCEQEWPGKTSIILTSKNAPSWLRRDNHSVAYRLPDSEALMSLLVETGPLIAPSANPEGLPPAMTLAEARNYFANHVDFYVDGGRVTDDAPSRLLRIDAGGSIEQLR